MKSDRTKPTRARSAAWHSIIAVVAGASGVVGATALDVGDAAANPPAPTGMPDPAVVPPTVAEAPNVVRLHDGGCFVYYPSGGVARVTCPPELAGQPKGEEIDRDPSTGKCSYIPTVSWSGGKMGPVTCPSVLRVIATVAGTGTAVAPTGTPATAVPSMTNVPPPNASEGDPEMYGLHAPGSSSGGTSERKPPGRLDSPETKSGGCGNGCAIGSDVTDARVGSSLAIAAMAGVIAARRRRKRS